MGVLLPRVAAPPDKDSEKSLACKAPLPPVALKTASFMVTAMVALSAATTADEILGLTVLAARV